MSATHATREIHFSAEARAKISAKATGRKNPAMIGNKHAAGKGHSQEWKDLMSEKMTGRKMQPFTDEHRLKLSIAAKSRHAREKAAKGI